MIKLIIYGLSMKHPKNIITCEQYYLFMDQWQQWLLMWTDIKIVILEILFGEPIWRFNWDFFLSIVQ